MKWVHHYFFSLWPFHSRHKKKIFKKAVVQMCSVKKMFFEISRNSQENTCARVSFLNKVAGPRLNYSDILHYKQASLKWRLDDIRKEKTISAPISFTNCFLEVSALLNVRHCSKLQSCATSRKYNDGTFRKWQKPKFRTKFGSR